MALVLGIYKGFYKDSCKGYIRVSIRVPLRDIYKGFYGLGLHSQPHKVRNRTKDNQWSWVSLYLTLKTLYLKTPKPPKPLKPPKPPKTPKP